MKTIIKKLIYAILFLLPYHGFSQSGYTGAIDMDVNGVFIGGTYTKTQVEEKWGNPTKYWSGESEFGIDEEYYYNSNLFRFSDNGIFHSFSIKTPDFVVFTAHRGGIKVGDKVTKILSMGVGAIELQKDGTYHLNKNNSDDPLVIEHSNGIITRISFVTSI